MGAVPTSSIPQLVDQIPAGWQTLDVPVFLITCQLLLLTWLLLFLIVTEAAEARGGEVALAKLRGHGRLSTVTFGLSEPVLLLALGLPAGLLAGWAAAAGLARILLRPGTHAGLPALAIAAAAAATLGGLVATVLAARRALVRPVTEQWRRTGRRVADRGWVLDAVLLTGALAGLAELILAGGVTSARSGSLGLLVPGLLGLAAAVIASRLLPVACGLAFAATRRRGGTGLFLAVRHIARRPGGTRTTIVLTAAFALATFAVAAFSVDQRNVDRVATTQTGAAAVLTVTAPARQDLGTIVDRIDPGGDQAAAVDRYAGGTDNGAVLLAVQPERFARVALWPSGSLDRPPASLGPALDPRVPPAVTLPAGSAAVRVRVTGPTGIAPGTDLTLWVVRDRLAGRRPGTGQPRRPAPGPAVRRGHRVPVPGDHDEHRPAGRHARREAGQRDAVRPGRTDHRRLGRVAGAGQHGRLGGGSRGPGRLLHYRRPGPGGAVRPALVVPLGERLQPRPPPGGHPRHAACAGVEPAHQPPPDLLDGGA